MADTVGQRILQKRKELNLSQEELARRVGVDRTTVAKWESGSNNLKQSVVKKLADALECSPVWLVGLDNPDIMIEFEATMNTMTTQQLNRIMAYATYLIARRDMDED